MFTHPTHVIRPDGRKVRVQLQMDSCVAAGYTGRNQKDVQSHIDELKKLGVPTPYSTPAMYWISPARLTTLEQIIVVGEQTSPEVEFFTAGDSHGNFYITVASDHTDRELETVSVGKAKQICEKVIGDDVWLVDDMANHWDEIKIKSKVLINNKWHLYQSGTLGEIMALADLLSLMQNDQPAGSQPALLSGTIPIIGGDTIYTTSCELIMIDPVLNRKLTKQYRILSLPDRS
ncbi:MAG: DUF2848 family protein [Desulfobacterales bacterium]|nr:DUF2848 family protein [Desulfobacterales bacterium]